jgi:hypothetical protein
MLPLLLPVIEPLLKNVCRRKLDDTPDSKARPQCCHNPTFPAVWWITPSGNHPADRSNRTECNTHHCVCESLTVEKQESHEPKQKAK